MPTYRIHRLRAYLRPAFRSAPHVSGAADVKPRDYEPGEEAGEEVDARTPYAAFFAMKESGQPLEPGDLLESAGGALCIYKYVGFEQARWILPEEKQAQGQQPEANPADARADAVLAGSSEE